MSSYLLPTGWPKHAKTALLHAIAIASTAFAVARGHAASGMSMSIMALYRPGELTR